MIKTIYTMQIHQTILSQHIGGIIFVSMAGVGLVEALAFHVVETNIRPTINRTLETGQQDNIPSSADQETR